jgi:negative regulator of sigma E activity
LENAAKNYSDMDSLAIVEIREEILDNCSKIDYRDDNLHNKIIIHYTKINSSIEQILKIDFQLKKDIVKSRTQINNLLYDVNNDLIDTSLLVHYIADEKKKINRIIDRINYNYERVIAETRKYDSLNPLIKNLIYINN